MAEWEKQEVELDKRGIYCSFGTYMTTKDYSLFITRADGKSLMDYFCKKECLEILNKFIDKNYETFDDFMKVNGFVFKENELGKYLVLRDIEKLDYIEKFNRNSIVASFSFIAKAFLKLLTLNLAIYLKCKAVYSNNEIIGLGKESGNGKVLKETKFEDNLISQIIEEVFVGTFVKEVKDGWYYDNPDDKSFRLFRSNTYEVLRNNLGVLNKEYDEIGNIYKINNEENPAYMQKIGKVDFLTKGYYFFDRKNDKKMANHFKIEDFTEDELAKRIKDYFTKGTIKETDNHKKKLMNTNLCCFSGIVGDSFGIFIDCLGQSKISPKKIISLFENDKFLETFNKSFKTPFKSFKEFLDVNNFKIIENENFAYIEVLKLERDSSGKLTNYVKGFSAYVELLSIFLTAKLSECFLVSYKDVIINSFKNILTNEGTKIKVMYNSEKKKNKNTEILLDNANMFEVILKEIKENFTDDFLLNLERLRTVLKNPNNHLETVKFISTNTYIELEEFIKKLLKETDIKVEVVSNEDNTAYLLTQKLINNKT
jgi:hypothetical protein